MAARRERVPGEAPRREPVPAPYAAPVPWWAVLLQGIVSALIGAALLAAPGMTTAILVQFLGIYWLVAGVFALVRMFLPGRRVGWGWLLVGGALGIIAGLAVLRHPLWSTVLIPTLLVLYLGAYGIVIGIVHLIEAAKGGGWGIGVLGALSILIGALLLLSPLQAALALPWVIGIFALAGGIIAIVGSFGLKRAEPPHGERARPAA